MYRCNKCHRELKHGVLEDGKLYCYKCYYIIKNPVTNPTLYTHQEKPFETQIFI